MAFIDLSRDLFENVTITLTPTVTYTSGSTTGITGSAYLMPLKSKRVKEIRVMEFPDASAIVADASNISHGFDEVDAFKINSLSGVAQQINAGNSQAIANLKSALERYMVAVNVSPLDVRYDKNLPITRIEQPTTFATASVIKRHIKNVLMPHYRTQYDDCGFYYRNYHTLNFFTGSTLNSSTALIYHNQTDDDPLYKSSLYYNDTTGLKEFTLQFWINPRYQNEANSSFHAGTIFHLSGTLAVSLISGSQKDSKGRVNTYKILTQLDDTAMTPPHKADNFSGTTFFTSSFELKHNHWHHVSIRWGGEQYNNKTGSIIIDGNENRFVVPSASIGPINENNLYNNNTVYGLVVGNFFQGETKDLSTVYGENRINEGIRNIGPISAIHNAKFENPLNAEIHEIKFYHSYLNDNYIVNSGSGVTKQDLDSVENNGHNLKFYLPPYFYPESFKERKLLFAPEFQVTTSSYTPTNNLFSFAAGGKEVNLENFTREMVQKHPAKLLGLTASIDSSFDGATTTVDEFIFNGKNAKRNLTILPNDNGLFNPSYYIIEKNLTGSLQQHYSGDAYNNTPNNYDLIKLENGLIGIAEGIETKFNQLYITSPSLKNNIFGGTAQISNYSLTAQSQIQAAIDGGKTVFLAALSELKEDSSNYIAIFNISNLYYGNQIKPGSFQISDNTLTGSQGKISMTLKDNGRGGVYRADCLTKQADWNCVGNLFYDEGLLIIKSPHLSLFGKDNFSTSFKGEHNVHSLVINVPAPRGFFDKSVNPSFVSLPKSENLNDEDTESIAITSVNIHDENFNIIMRANLAQPIIKDKSDEFVIRLKMDF